MEKNEMQQQISSGNFAVSLINRQGGELEKERTCPNCSMVGLFINLQSSFSLFFNSGLLPNIDSQLLHFKTSIRFKIWILNYLEFKIISNNNLSVGKVNYITKAIHAWSFHGQIL